MSQTQNQATTVMEIPHMDPWIIAGFFTLSYTGMNGSRMVMGDGTESSSRSAHDAIRTTRS